MFGAIIGDVIGSRFEGHNTKRTDFHLFNEKSRFTDDTVLTVAVAECILKSQDYSKTIREYGLKYPRAGYGGKFKLWLTSDSFAPYNSYGNGSAMRVSPVGFAFDNFKKVIEEAKNSAEVTHNHPEGIKGAQAVAAAIFWARNGEKKSYIKQHIQDRFRYDLSPTLAEIRPTYTFDVSCQGSVPQAIIAFLESENFEDAIRKAISLGGDSDTIACMTGGIAQAFYQVIPDNIMAKVRGLLDPNLIRVVDEFAEKFGF